MSCQLPLGLTHALPGPANESQYLAICAASKDDGREVREWVEYHLAAGVSKIYLFDTDNPQPVEPFLVVRGCVRGWHVCWSL